jgi:hypothetical protein
VYVLAAVGHVGVSAAACLQLPGAHTCGATAAAAAAAALLQAGCCGKRHTRLAAWITWRLLFAGL